MITSDPQPYRGPRRRVLRLWPVVAFLAVVAYFAVAGLRA
jgi:hypothetical protein